MTEIRIRAKRRRNDPPMKQCGHCLARAPAAAHECQECGMHFHNHPSVREAALGDAMERAMRAEFGFSEIERRQ